MSTPPAHDGTYNLLIRTFDVRSTIAEASRITTLSHRDFLQ